MYTVLKPSEITAHLSAVMFFIVFPMNCRPYVKGKGVCWAAIWRHEMCPGL